MLYAFAIIGLAAVYFSLQPEKSFPYVSLLGIIFSILSFFIFIANKKRRRKLSTIALIFSITFLTFGTFNFQKDFGLYKNRMEFIKQVKLEMLKKHQEEQKPLWILGFWWDFGVGPQQITYYQ